MRAVPGVVGRASHTKVLKTRGLEVASEGGSGPSTSTSQLDLFLDLDVTLGTSIDPTTTATKKHQSRRTPPAKMLSATMRSAAAQALRPCARGLPAKSLPSRGAIARRSFLVAPSYKSRLAVRGFATATASKTTGRTAAKPATKTKAAPKAKATATKAKKTAKAPAKKKKVAAKPKKPVVKKKEVTPEKKQALLKRELKQKSLVGQEPKPLPANKWTVFMTGALKGKPGGGLSETRNKVAALSTEFKSLSPAELEVCIPIPPPVMSNRVLTEPLHQRLEETAVQNKAVNAGNWKTWIESHSVAEIQQANLARRRLKRETEFKIKPYPIRLVDERLPKRPANSGYAYFIKAKQSDAPRTGGLSRFSKALSEEWHALSATEKKPYDDLAAAEKAKFTKEMEKLTI